jgi:hypothetical protein
MVARSTVTFERLEQLLLDLGFTQRKRGNFWVFAHAPSRAILTYRPPARTCDSSDIMLKEGRYPVNLC